MRRSPNIIYVGDRIAWEYAGKGGEGRVCYIHGPRLRVIGGDGAITWVHYDTVVPLPDEPARYLRTASPVQGHRSGRGDAAREPTLQDS